MAKIILGKRPDSFKRVVKFNFVDGTEGRVVVDYTWRTRREFTAFLEEHFKPAPDAAEGDEQTPALDVVGNQAAYLAKIVTGWDLEAKLSIEALEQLCDELPAAANAIVANYATAINEGRLGN
jgi:hypothetical protein